MKNRLTLFLCLIMLASYTPTQNNNLQSGDLIFHTTSFNLSKMVHKATHSPYNQVGVLFFENNTWYVLDNGQPVKLTPLTEWIKQGENGHYVIKRLKNSNKILTPSKTIQLRTNTKHYLGKSFDARFEWSDDKMYPSEMVYKLYNETFAIQLGQMQKLCDLDFSDPIVGSKMHELFGDKLPCDQKLITPASIFDSEHLIEVLRK